MVPTPNLASPASETTPLLSNGRPDKTLKLKAVLFDVDGTMADTDVYHRRVFKDLLLPMGIHCDDQLYNEKISGKANSQLHQILVPHLSVQDATELFIEKERRFRELAKSELQPLTGLVTLIQTVQSHGVKVAAVTNAPRPNVEFMLTLFGLASVEHPISATGSAGVNGRLDTVVLGEDCAEAKPSPVPYQLAMERLGVKPDECIVFEDSSSGATAGVAAGCQTIGILTTKTEEQMKELGCFGVIHDYTQIDVNKLMTSMSDYIKPADSAVTATHSTK